MGETVGRGPGEIKCREGKERETWERKLECGRGASLGQTKNLGQGKL